MSNPESVGVVRTENRDGLALVLIDNAPVNALSQAVRQGLLEAIEAANGAPSVEAIVIACEGRTFIAGADIREFGKPAMPPMLPDVLQAIEDSAKPVVAAIHGTALGGGCETALAAHARVLSTDAAVGLPEVKLGLIPGAGGTQRLPRLIGMEAALDIAASGRQVKAREALSLGFADRVAEGDLRGEAMELARSLVGMDLRRLSRATVPPFDRERFASAAAAVKKKARGQLSPGAVADAVALAAELPFAEGIKRERASFLELREGDQSKALRHAFFAEREVTRVPHLEGTSARPVQTVGVIGAGTMGAGIAVAFVDAGYPVRVVEMTDAAVAAGQDRIAAVWNRQVKSGRISEGQRDAKLAQVSVGSDMAALTPCDLIVEAAFEDMGVKKDIFSRLAPLTKHGAVLATNTSYLDVNEIARMTNRPTDVIGLHFFSPANIMRLVEVVESDLSAKDAVATGVAVAKKMGKIPVVCGVCDGFVGNRILAMWRAVAEFALEQGALPQDVDAALEAFGFAMGPFAVSDLAGLDIGWARRKRLAPTRDPAARYPSTVADRLCEMGRFGQKTSAGWYAYVDGKREVDPSVSTLVKQVSAEKGIDRKPVAAATIQRQVRAAMINEGAKILAEGIVPRALDIDVVLVHGYGYPAWRGGPMFEADAIGLESVLEDVRDIHAMAGTGYEPAPLLLDLARTGRRFADLAPGEGKKD